MEHEAFVRSLTHINGKVTCNELVTDASSSIRKTMGNTLHYIVVYKWLCVWYMQLPSTLRYSTHLIFGIRQRKYRKPLLRYFPCTYTCTSHLYPCTCIGWKTKGMEKLSQWSSNIVNHFWYCCRTCNGNEKMLKVNQSTKNKLYNTVSYYYISNM